MRTHETFKFGMPLLSRNEFLQTILNCFFEIIDKEGALIISTFTYSFCKKRSLRQNKFQNKNRSIK